MWRVLCQPAGSAPWLCVPGDTCAHIPGAGSSGGSQDGGKGRSERMEPRFYKLVRETCSLL